MSIEDDNVVDIVGTDKASGRVILTIADHLEWDEAHMTLLERKVGTYIRFIESGQLVESRPDAKGRDVEISLSLRHAPTREASEYLEAVRRAVEERGHVFSYVLVPEKRTST